MPKINVCIATYDRNDQLYRTVASLAAQDLSGLEGIDLTVCIVDNNPDQRADAVFRRAQADFPDLKLACWQEPQPGVVHVRNTALRRSDDADFVAFIDDDQIATTDWLAALLACQRGTGSAVCHGPILAQYPPETPDWLRAGDFQSVRYARTRTGKRPGSVGNSLIDMAALKATGLQFDPATSLTGGEDTLLFTLMHRRGAVLAECADAAVLETVPPERATFAWQMKRWRREGGTDAMVKYHGRPVLVRRAGSLFDGLLRLSAGGALAALAFAAGGLRMNTATARRLYTFQRGRGMAAYAFGRQMQEYARSGQAGKPG